MVLGVGITAAVGLFFGAAGGLGGGARSDRGSAPSAANRGLWGEVASMAFDTLRTNKMRSALTILGVVIGITSIVGMTSLIRGFDECFAT